MIVQHTKPLSSVFLPTALAISITLASLPVPALAAPGEVNSTNTGRDVQAGNYFNTAGSRTTFVNNNGGLWVRSGDTVRGLESNAAGTPNGNGGTLYFRAPGNIIRIDGTIDASAVKNGTIYTGNGGKVFMDSAYLFQSGNIFANGFNGGLVQLNVGGLTMTPTARITAQGFGGNGGAININSPGTIDIQNGAVIDTSGRVIGTFDTNVINIEGSMVNNTGLIRANGIATTDFKANNSDAAIMSANPQLANNPNPGTIAGGTGTGVIMDNTPATSLPPGPTTNRGGTIRLVASGQNISAIPTFNRADTTILPVDMRNQLINREALLLTQNGTVFNTNILSALGANGQNGGTVLLAAANNIFNSSTIDVSGGAGGTSANGGNGGTIGLTAMNNIINNGILQANGGTGGSGVSASVATGSGQNAVALATGGGQGGSGGLIALSYRAMENRGRISANGGIGGTGGTASSYDSESAPTNATARATSTGGNGGQGGNGGLIVLSSDNNPIAGGIISANGGQGGNGGHAISDAHAIVGSGMATALTTMNPGAAGSGGQAGTVVAPNTNLPSSQVYTATAGGLGTGGGQRFIRTITQNGVTTNTTETTLGAPGSAQQGPNNTIQVARRNEIAVHGENAFLLSKAGGMGVISDTLSGRLADAIVRTVSSPLGANVSGLNATRTAANFVLASTSATPLTNNFINNNIDPIYFNLNTLTMLNNGTIDNNMHWSPGIHQTGPGFHDSTLSLGGGKLSFLSSGSIINDGVLLSRGLWSGGSIMLGAAQNITNNGVTLNTSFNKHTATGFARTPGYLSSHAGSTIFKAGGNIVNNFKLNSLSGFENVHPAIVVNGVPTWLPFLNGAQIGSTLYMKAGGSFTNTSNAQLAADALTYRDTSVDAGAQHPGNAIGGIMTFDTGGNVNLGGSVTNIGRSFSAGTGNFFFQTPAGLTNVSNQNGSQFLTP